MAGKQQEIPAAVMAKLLGLSLARVGQLAKEGVITRLSNGKYQPEAITRYIENLRDRSAAPGTVSAKIEEEKLRRLRRENDIEEQLVAPVSVLTDALERVSAQIVPILDSIPLEMKRLNPTLNGHDIQTVKKAIARARNAIAEVNIEIEANV